MPRYLTPPTGHDFFALSKTEPNPRSRTRLLVLAQLAQGRTPAEVAVSFDLHPITVRSLLTRFHQDGLSVIHDREGRGRHTKLPESQHESAKQAILKAQADLGGGRLTALHIQALLKKDYAVEYTHNSVYGLLHRLGLSWISARSSHPKRNQHVQDEYKKNLGSD